MIKLIAPALAFMLSASPNFAQDSKIRDVSELRIAIVMPCQITDFSWCQTAHAGLMFVQEKLGVEIAFQELVPDVDVERALRGYAEQGFDLILAENTGYQDANLRVAQDYPDLHFATVAGYITQSQGAADSPGNHAAYDWPAHQAAYVAGVLAARMTETGIIGFISAQPVPDIARQFVGFQEGIQSVNTDLKLAKVLTGSWIDPGLAQEGAAALVEAGADVVMQAVSAPGVAALKTIAESGNFVIGYEMDQRPLAPKKVLTSIMLNKGMAYEEMLKAIANGTFESKEYLYDMLEGGVVLAPLNDVIPANVAAEFNSILQQVLDGDIEISNTTKMPD